MMTNVQGRSQRLRVIALYSVPTNACLVNGVSGASVNHCFVQRVGKNVDEVTEQGLEVLYKSPKKVSQSVQEQRKHNSVHILPAISGMLPYLANVFQTREVLVGKVSRQERFSVYDIFFRRKWSLMRNVRL
jgi:hypothetical protein